MRGWILIIGLFCGNCHADWWTDSKVTNGLMISANVLMVADWAQTRYVADNPVVYYQDGSWERYWEKGPASYFIGDRPTSGEVNRYFVASIVLMNLTGYLLPEKYKNWFYLGANVYQGGFVYSNYDLGVGFEF